MKVSLYRCSLLISLYSLEVLVKDMASVQIQIPFMCNNGHLRHGSVLTMVEKTQALYRQLSVDHHE